MSTDPRTELTAAQEAMRNALPSDAFETVWDEFNAAYQEFRDRNPGWRAFYTNHHKYALDAALKALATVLDLDARDARVRAETAEGIAREMEEELTGSLVCAWTKTEAVAIAHDYAASPSSSPVDAPAASSEQRGCPETVWDGPYSFVCNKGATVGVCHQHGRFRDAPSRPTGDDELPSHRGGPL